MEGRRLVQFYAGGKVKSRKPKTDHTMPTEMAPAPGAAVSADADGPAMKKGGPTAHRKRGGKTKVKVKVKNKLAMGGPPMDPMAGRMTTGLAARMSGGRGMPTAGGMSPRVGGGPGPQRGARPVVPSMMGALGPIR